jgi:exodeoxyribonuclease V beta subunit
MDGSSPDNGIFATRPAEAFVEEIDALFGETGEML